VEMTLDMHQLTSGLTDLVAVWSRIQGVCEHIYPLADEGFVDRIGFERLTLKEGAHERSCSSLAQAVEQVLARPTGLVAVRGGNGTGKSTLLSALKCHLRGAAFYWPTHDRLSFAFNSSNGREDALFSSELEGESSEEAEDAAELSQQEESEERRGYSSGERQLRVLREIVAKTNYRVYLLDEWDANLDAANRLAASELVDQLAQRARVLEISHRDR
ncbi:MAG TPA: ABC transporter ATP-binding protein, partial [Accumulibacter sp.]